MLEPGYLLLIYFVIFFIGTVVLRHLYKHDAIGDGTIGLLVVALFFWPFCLVVLPFTFFIWFVILFITDGEVI